jgi:hypothetical protein
MSDPPILRLVETGSEALPDQQANEVPVRLTGLRTRILNEFLDGLVATKGAESEQRESGGGSMDANERKTRLETHFEYIQRDLSDIKSGQKNIIEKLGSIGEKVSVLPTRSELATWRMQTAAICVTAIALIVGGIIGGLNWIKPATEPIIIRSDVLQPPNGHAANIPPTSATPGAPAPH